MTALLSAIALELPNRANVRITMKASRKDFFFMAAVSRFRVFFLNQDSPDFSPLMQLRRICRQRPRGNAHTILFQSLGLVTRLIVRLCLHNSYAPRCSSFEIGRSSWNFCVAYRDVATDYRNVRVGWIVFAGSANGDHHGNE